MGMDMTKDPFMVKAVKISNALTFLADDSDEAKSILIYLLGKMMAPNADWDGIVAQDGTRKLHDFLVKEKEDKTEWV
jgi:hypothetical protein